MTEDEHLASLTRIINILAAAVDDLQQPFPQPTYDEEQQRFRHDEIPLELVRVLKAVRVASGLRSACILIREGHVVEALMLFRGIDDFVEEIDFLQPEGEWTQHQEQFLQNYVEDIPETADEMLVYERKFREVDRKKVRAHVARKLQENNPHRIVQISKVIDDSFSGAVHGSYRSTIDMFRPENGRFSTFGMAGTPRIRGYRIGLAQTLHRALNVIALLADNLGRHDISHALIDQRIALEASTTYAG